MTWFGAVGDGKKDDTRSIAKAVAAAKALPSPVTVVFPANKTFLTLPINMSSFMTLQIDGTVLAKNGTAQDWPQIPPLPSYGNSRDGNLFLQYQAVVYARDATFVKITGKGTIDGGGEWWWANKDNRSLVTSGRPNLMWRYLM